MAKQAPVELLPSTNRVSAATVIAIKALSQEQAVLQARLNQVLSEAGLDPAVSWQITPDGVATPRTED